MTSKVVTIEDEKEIADLLRLVLQHEAIEVSAAHDGKTGLAMIREMKPDLILLDVMMPEMSGWEVYEAVRADDALKSTPIIMVSVRPQPAERKRAFARSEIDSYVTKPFDAARLRREIGRMLGTPKLWPVQLRATGEFKPSQSPAYPVKESYSDSSEEKKRPLVSGGKRAVKGPESPANKR